MTLRGAALVDQILARPVAERDAWCDELLGLGELPPDGELPRGAVPYVPCGVAEILAMVQDAPVREDDLLVDIGAGLGRVLMLAHLITGARGHGIEIQGALVEAGRVRCAGYPIELTHANAADIALDGSRFFLYAPCNGELLERVIARIHEVALRGPIVIGCVGLELDVPWLKARASTSPALTLYES